MSEENVEIVRQVLDAYRRGDKAAWTNLMDPELETDPVAAWPEPGPFIGPDAAWDFYKQFEEMWAAREAYQLTELIGAGNRCSSVKRLRCVAKQALRRSALSSGP